MLKKNSQKGFTIVELLIVIVVIGILAALVLNTFAGVQKRARDTERQTDATAISTQLERYYADNGRYPILSEVTTDNLKGIDAGALKAPGQTATSLASTATPTKDQYGYITYDDATPRAECTVVGTPASCGSHFKLYWYSEDKGIVQGPKDSLN